MNAKCTNPIVKTLLTGLIVGGSALASLATTGCDRSLVEQANAAPSVSVAQIADLLQSAEKPDVRSKLAAIHNETFLVWPSA